MNDIRSILNLLERKAYTIQSNGSIVNWNIDKKKPFRDVMHQGKLTRVYATTAQLDKAFPESILVAV